MGMDPGKILLVSHEMTYTGAPRSLLEMGRLLRDCGFSVDVWTLKSGEFEEEFRKQGMEAKKISFPEDASEALSEQLAGYGLAIANTIFCAAFAGYAQRFTRTVLYIREAGNIPELIQNCDLEEADFLNVTHKVCVSEYARDCIVKQYGSIPVTVIPNFVPDEFVKTEKASKHFHRVWDGQTHKNEALHFLVSGTLEPRKGQDVAIGAYRLLDREEKKQIRLHLVGPAPEWASSYQKELELEQEGVIYHGEIHDRKELLSLYSSMDAVLVPSRDESCSLVALEACMLGKPVFLTENTGAKYFADPSCIVKTGDCAALKEKLSEAVRNPMWLQKMGKDNRTAYLEKASEAVYRKNILTYLKQLKKENKPEPPVQPKVSVVVPIYNVEKYLSCCMDSICSQTLKEMEIICVNDGSTDSSPAILEAYRKKDSRIRLINTENHGYGHAMNLGMDEANGEYIGIVEPDDYIVPDMYEILYHRALAADSDIVKSDFFRFYGENGHRREIYQKTARDDRNYNRIIHPRQEKECFRFIMNTWPGIYRRAFLQQYGIRHNETPGASFQDNGFWFQGFCQAERITFVNRALYYNRRDNPGSSVNDRKKLYCANEEYDWIRQFLSDHTELEKEFLFQYSMKKYHTCLFTLDRIGWEYKEEYLHRFAEEFRSAEKRGELSKAVFTPQEWTKLHWLMRDEKEYYEKQVLGEIQISVVVPIYNAEKYLEQCLESLENQTFRKIEIICVDDGSTDASEEIIDRFTARDRRFRKVIQENSGAGAARNKGLSLARGEYIIFLDSDDYFAPDMLKHAYNKIREDEADICVMGSWQHDEATDSITPCTYSLQLENYPPFRPFRTDDMTKNPFRCFVGWAWDKLYLKRFLLDSGLRFQELRTSNDMYFTYMSLFKAGKITTLDERLIYQRRNREGSLSMTRGRSWDCFLDALLAMKKELCEMGLFEKNRIYFENYALHSCLWNLGTLPEDAAEELYEALFKQFFSALGISHLRKEQIEFSQEAEELTELFQDKTDGIHLCQERYRTKGKNIQEKKLTSMTNLPDENYYLYCLEEIRKSKSYKIGLAVTWLPRKIRGW